MKKENVKFKRNQTVMVRLHGAGTVSEEMDVVTRVTSRGVWLDHSGGPFVDGKRDGVFGFWSEIIDTNKK